MTVHTIPFSGDQGIIQQRIEHEKQVLGACMKGHRHFQEASLDIAEPNYFIDGRHANLWCAVRDLYNSDRQTYSVVDPMVIDSNYSAIEVQRLGGLVYLNELVHHSVIPENVGFHAEKVRQHYLADTTKQIGEAIASMERDSEGLLAPEQIEAAMDKLASAMRVYRTGVNTNADLTDRLIAGLGQPFDGTRTPWDRLNKAMGGWKRGELAVVGARPGVGKSAVAVEIALEAARQGHVLFCSLEMESSEVWSRIATNITGIPNQRLTDPQFYRPEDAQLLEDLRDTLDGLNITLEDSCDMTVGAISSRIRELQRTRQVDLVIVDYLQILKSTNRRAKRNEQVAEQAQALHDMAQAHGVPMVGLCQLNREVEGRADKAPTIADIGESSRIEAAANQIILLHRDQIEEPKVLHMALAKNRRGRLGRFDLDFDGAHSRIKEIPQGMMGVLRQ